MLSTKMLSLSFQTDSIPFLRFIVKPILLSCFTRVEKQKCGTTVLSPRLLEWAASDLAAMAFNILLLRHILCLCDGRFAVSVTSLVRRERQKLLKASIDSSFSAKAAH